MKPCARCHLVAHWRAVAGVAALLVLVVACVAAAEEVVLYPTQAAYTFSCHPDSNYSWDDELIVGKTGTTPHVWRTYIEFDLSGVSGEIEAATLNLRQFAGGGGAGGLLTGVHSLLGPWDEDTITWDGSPAYGAYAHDTVRCGGGGAYWIIWEVTTAVAAWIEGGEPNHGLVARLEYEGPAGAPRHARFCTTEHPFEHWWPRLIIQVEETTAIAPQTWGAIKAGQR